MIVNRLVLSGTVCNSPTQRVSPSGVSHLQFVIEHQSQQYEAGFNRLARCKMPVVLSGSQSKQLVESITIGCSLVIHGFVCSHQDQRGLNKLVLHAEQIELIGSGDSPYGTLFPSS